MSVIPAAVCICGAGTQAMEARKGLAELGVPVTAFLRLPWDTPPLVEDSVVHDPGDLPDLPLLLATAQPRKALKLLRPLLEKSPHREVFRDFTSFFEAMRKRLQSSHPGLFPARPDPDNRRMFDYERSLLPNRLLALFDQDVRSLDQAFGQSGLSIGYPGWNLLYYSCLCSLRPDTDNLIIETGANVGCSTIVLAQALKDSGYSGRVLSVDLDPAVLETAGTNLRLAGVGQYVSLFQGDSVSFLQNVEKQRRPGEAVSFAFLDGCHEAGHVENEFAALHPQLDRRSCVFFDNVAEDDGVAGALWNIQKRFRGNVVHFENCSWHPPGQAVWQFDGGALEPCS